MALKLLSHQETGEAQGEDSRKELCLGKERKAKIGSNEP